jgi:UDP-N-acetylmuramoylalanine--D-glutamate ligase
MNQTADDVAVLNADDEITLDWAEGLNAKVVMFSVKRELETGVFLRDRHLIYKTDGAETVLTTRNEIFLRGLHNVENVLAAFAAGIAAGVAIESIRKTVANFKGVEHRIEFVAELDGVKYYNDSKATSVDATIKALEALSEEPGEKVLILGGKGKNAPYAPLIPLIEQGVRAIVVIGEDGDNIAAQLDGTTEILRAKSLDEAVQLSRSAAIHGDSVLLAPACASFDMFNSFEERGTVFKAAVNGLV